jgi:hypothetical protein
MLPRSFKNTHPQSAAQARAKRMNIISSAEKSNKSDRVFTKVIDQQRIAKKHELQQMIFSFHFCIRHP